jgi:hypothetical protein
MQLCCNARHLMEPHNTRRMDSARDGQPCIFVSEIAQFTSCTRRAPASEVALLLRAQCRVIQLAGVA